MTDFDQPPPTPEREDQPACWDLVIADVEAAYGGDLDGLITKHDDSLRSTYNALLLYMGLIRRVMALGGEDSDVSLGDLLDWLRADMRDRDQKGRAEYGTPLQPFNGRSALADAYQEILDATVYLRQYLYERDGK